MSKLTDEMLNKYLDGDLEVSDLEAVKEELNSDPDALARLRALRAVDATLKTIEADHAPENISDRIMKKISAGKYTVKTAPAHFFISIISILLVGIISVTVAAFRSASHSSANNNLVDYTDKIKNTLVKNAESAQNFFSNPGVVFTVGALTIIFLIAAYFTIESHKNFTKKFNSLSN